MHRVYTYRCGWAHPLCVCKQLFKRISEEIDRGNIDKLRSTAKIRRVSFPPNFWTFFSIPEPPAVLLSVRFCPFSTRRSFLDWLSHVQMFFMRLGHVLVSIFLKQNISPEIPEIPPSAVSLFQAQILQIFRNVRSVIFFFWHKILNNKTGFVKICFFYFYSIESIVYNLEIQTSWY